jgi:Recombination endonuclease VII
MPKQVKCIYEKCDTEKLTGGAKGYCGAHYRQLLRGEELRPVRGSKWFWEAQLNENGEKQCSRCGYWLNLKEFHDRRDGSRVNQDYGRAHCRRCNILRRMGLTARDFDEMLEAQGGGCAICRVKVDPNGRQLCVDHDHACHGPNSACEKCIRGILCNSCNAMLGYAKNSPYLLLAAAHYLGRKSIREFDPLDPTTWPRHEGWSEIW